MNDLSNHTFVTTHTPTYKGGKTITKILAEVQPSSNPKNILEPNTASLHILRCNVYTLQNNFKNSFYHIYSYTFSFYLRNKKYVFSSKIKCNELKNSYFHTNFNSEHCNLNSNGCNLNSNDYNLNSNSCNLNSNDYNLNSDGYNLNSNDCNLNSDGCNLNSNDYNLNSDGYNLNSNDCNLNSDEYSIYFSFYVLQKQLLSIK